VGGEVRDVTESHTTFKDGRQDPVWPRWCAWMLGDTRKAGTGFYFFLGAVIFFNGAMATWHFFAGTYSGWVHAAQLLGPPLLVAGLVYLWAEFRLHRHRAEEP